MPELFLDTGFAIALASRRDRYHERAVQLADRIRSTGTRLVTTRAVVLEIGNSLAKPNLRPAAIRLIASMQADPGVDVLPVDGALFDRSFRLFGD